MLLLILLAAIVVQDAESSKIPKVLKNLIEVPKLVQNQIMPQPKRPFTPPKKDTKTKVMEIVAHETEKAKGGG
jgi:hypothetical protein